MITMASEGQTHWYKVPTGEPFYTMIGRNGKERNVTLRDAKKLGNIVSSVTKIMKEAARPGLDVWIQHQVLLAALTLPMIANETEAEWIDRIMADSKQQAIVAAERGKQIHTWVQQGFEGKLREGDAGYEYYKSAFECLSATVPGMPFWICEKSFATDKFGGKVDMHSLTAHKYVIDIKTKDTSLENIKTYDDHAMQLAAYRHGLGLYAAKCAILFVSTLDKTAKLCWIEEENLVRGWKMFSSLLDYWYYKTGLLVREGTN